MSDREKQIESSRARDAVIDIFEEDLHYDREEATVVTDLFLARLWVHGFRVKRKFQPKHLTTVAFRDRHHRHGNT